MSSTAAASKTAKAYRHLRQFIEEGRFNGEKPLTEKELARRLGMSRGPIRESLVRLQSEGLLQAKGSRRGRVVTQFTEDQDLGELLFRYELREQIEVGAVRLAAKNMNGWQIDHLASLAAKVTEYTLSGESEPRYAATSEFHHYLIANCGNPLLFQVWEQFRLSPPRPKSVETEQRIFQNMPAEQRDQPWLEDVVEAIAAHDQDRAESLMRVRIRAVTEALRKSLWTNGPK